MSTKKFVLRQPHYRQGIIHPAGTVIEVEASEKPSVTWDEADPKASAVLLPPLPKAPEAAKPAAKPAPAK